MMKALVWKDYRLASEVFFAGALLLAGPYLTVWVIMYVYGPTPFPWGRTAAYGGLASQWCALLTCALVAGNTVASEQEDGSTFFLEALPVRKTQILWSKIAVVLSYLPWLWAINVVVFLLAARTETAGADETIVNANLPEIGASAFFVFCIAWWVGGKMNSPVGAAMTSMAILAVVYYARYIISGRLPWEREEDSGGLFMAILIASGIVAFVSGIVGFVRKKE